MSNDIEEDDEPELEDDSYFGINFAVIDHGSHTIKAGIGGESMPKYVFPSNDKAIKNGNIVDWNEMTKLWDEALRNKLKMNPKENGVLLTHSVCTPKVNKQKMIQIMFEEFKVPAFEYKNSVCCSMFAVGKMNALVLESGHQTTVTVPVYEGYPLIHAVKRHNIGGLHVNNYMKTLCNENNTHLTNNMIQNIKETLCYISNSVNNDIHVQNYGLPDGETIELGSELFESTELLFGDDSFEGIHKMIYDSLQKCDDNIRSELFSNILLCGGNTMFKGIEQRLHSEMDRFLTKRCYIDGFIRSHCGKELCGDIRDIIYDLCDVEKVNIISPPSKTNAAWIGASMLSSLSSFRDNVIILEEYEECGPSIRSGCTMFLSEEQIIARAGGIPKSQYVHNLI